MWTPKKKTRSLEPEVKHQISLFPTEINTKLTWLDLMKGTLDRSYRVPQTSVSVSQHQNPSSEPALVYQDLSICHEWPVKKTIVNLPIRFKGNTQRIIKFKLRMKLNSDILIKISYFQSVDSQWSVLSNAKVISCLMGCVWVGEQKKTELYNTANDPETANDPQNGPQIMILDRKWSLKSTANDPERKIGMTWTQVSGSSCRFYCYNNKSD